MSSIKNIVFDLGAVLLNIDYNKTATAFRDLGYSDFEKMYSQFKANDIFDNLEMGHISEIDFYNYMLSAGNGKITQSEVTGAWNAMLLDFRKESFEFLNQLSRRYKLFLLSNTNAIHKTAFDLSFKQQMLDLSLDSFFTKAYYSNLVGMRKPNENIFRFVLEDAGIIAEETLFIDDLFKNIETAAKLGFRTHLLLPGQKIEDLNYDL
jgi:putative hydrolase of the HAD superfamily